MRLTFDIYADFYGFYPFLIWRLCNDLVVDPAYDEKTSIAAIRGFGDTANNQVDAGTSGTVDGRIFVGMNAALDVGVDASIDHMAEFIKQYQNAAGSLDRDNVGAVMYLSDVLTVSDGSRVILDSQRGASVIYKTFDPPLSSFCQVLVGDQF